MPTKIYIIVYVQYYSFRHEKIIAVANSALSAEVIAQTIAQDLQHIYKHPLEIISDTGSSQFDGDQTDHIQIQPWSIQLS